MSDPDEVAPRLGVLLLNTPTRGPLGADTWVHAQLVRWLDRDVVDVHVALATGPPGQPTPFATAIADVDDVHVFPVDFGAEPAVAPTGWRKVRRWLHDARVMGISFVRLAAYVRRSDIAVIHTVSRPRDALATVLLAKLSRRRSLVHMHVGLGDWMGRSLRWSLRHADGLVAISEFVASTLTASGIPSERVHVALNGVDVDRWTPVTDPDATRLALGLPRGCPLVVSVSRLFRSKGTAELVRAIALVRDELPDVHLVVVGRDVSGSGFMDELESIVRAEHLEGSVTFAGQQADVTAFIGAADVFAMPSHEEPFGLVFLEAMAMERPVVGLNNGGTVEVVEHGRDGLLAEPGDIRGLADDLSALLRDPRRRAEMGAYGRRQVLARFTFGHLARAMERTYVAVAR